MHANFETADDVTGIFSPVPTELHLNTPAGRAGKLEASSKTLLHTRKTIVFVVIIILKIVVACTDHHLKVKNQSKDKHL